MKKNQKIIITLALVSVVLLTTFSLLKDPNDKDASIVAKKEVLNEKGEREDLQKSPKSESKVSSQQAKVSPKVRGGSTSTKEKAKVIDSILKVSQFGQFKNQVLGGMQASLKGQKKLDKEKFKKFAESIAEYPIGEEFKKLLENYSAEELDYILGHMNHPAQGKMKEAQQRNQKELTAIAQDKSKYQADASKSEYIEQIFDETNMLEANMAISDAIVGPVLMATYKHKNPKANRQEMEAYAKKMLALQQPGTERVMENVLLWSLDQVDNETLEDLAQYISSYSDKGINDKYLADLKKLYGKFGRYIGDEIVRQLYKK